MNKPCTICGDVEPFHVHHAGERTEDYFTVGRGMTDLEAANAWKERALAAERVPSHEREAFEALLTLVAQKAMIGPGGTRHPYNLGTEHQTWALFGEWRAGAESVEEAQEALKDVIRTALTQQTGGADA